MGFRRQSDALHYAVRPRVVLRYFGQLSLVHAALLLIPLVTALIFSEFGFALRTLAVIAALVLCWGLSARLPAPRNIQTNEALCLAALIFLSGGALMSLPFMQSGLPFIDALFESLSGITTTGLTTMATVEDKSPAFLFTRAWMQWYGGLGIMALSLALVLQRGGVAQRLGAAESDVDDLVGGTRAHFRRVVLVYLVLTLIGGLLVWLANGDGFHAWLYALSAISTGGFAPRDASLGALTSWPARVVVAALFFAGSVSLIYYRNLIGKGWRKFFADPQLRMLLALSLTGATALALLMHFRHNIPWPHALRHAPLMAFSAGTTAGFNTLPIDGFDPASKLIFIVSMFVGGGVGSTAGGVKLLRLLVMLSLLRVLFARIHLPGSAVIHPRLGGRRLEPTEIEEAFCTVFLFLMVVAASWFAFLTFGHDPLDSLFEVVSATGTVGLSTGIASPSLHPALKLVLCMDMLMGRLEIIAWLVLLYPGTWIGKRRNL